MEEIMELVRNLNYYIQTLNTTPSFLEYFASTICPIISTFAIIIGGGFALYKYLAGKNYDINLKILNEVYVPLYSYLVKQETYRYIALSDVSWSEAPILEIKSTKTIQTLSASGLSEKQLTEGVCGCTRDALLALSRQTNLGIASTELVTLLNSYEMVAHISSGNINTKEKAKAVILQEKIEIALRKEILKGYKYYHKKLKLHNSHSDIYKITNEQVELLPTITEEEIGLEIKRLDKLQQ